MDIQVEVSPIVPGKWVIVVKVNGKEHRADYYEGITPPYTWLQTTPIHKGKGLKAGYL